MGDITESIAGKLRSDREAIAQREAEAANAAAAAAEAEAAKQAAAAQAAASAAAKPADAAAPADGEQKASSVSFKAIAVDEFGIVYGIGGAAGSTAKLDKDGEFIEKGDLCRLAFDFCAKGGRKFNANHDRGWSIDAQLVESWVGAPIIRKEGATRTLSANEVLDPATMTVIGINVEKGNETHWFVGVKPLDPEIVELAKSGGVAGFSWGAHVSKVEV